jgi:hypothetical protein
VLHRHCSHLACSSSQLSFSSWSMGCSLRRVLPTVSATRNRRQLEAWKHRGPLVSARVSYWLPLLWFKRVFLEHSSVAFLHRTHALPARPVPGKRSVSARAWSMQPKERRRNARERSGCVRSASVCCRVTLSLCVDDGRVSLLTDAAHAQCSSCLRTDSPSRI